MGDAGIADHPCYLLVRQVQVLENAFRQTSVFEGGGVAFGAEGVCCACFRMTALPAMMAGMTTFTEVR